VFTQGLGRKPWTTMRTALFSNIGSEDSDSTARLFPARGAPALPEVAFPAATVLLRPALAGANGGCRVRGRSRGNPNVSRYLRKEISRIDNFPASSRA
jgi:hypothetical protein